LLAHTNEAHINAAWSFGVGGGGLTLYRLQLRTHSVARSQYVVSTTKKFQ